MQKSISSSPDGGSSLPAYLEYMFVKPSVLLVFYKMSLLFIMIGGILGIAMGFDLITREKESKSLKTPPRPPDVPGRGDQRQSPRGCRSDRPRPRDCPGTGVWHPAHRRYRTRRIRIFVYFPVCPGNVPLYLHLLCHLPLYVNHMRGERESADLFPRHLHCPDIPGPDRRKFSSCHEDDHRPGTGDAPGPCRPDNGVSAGKRERILLGPMPR